MIYVFNLVNLKKRKIPELSVNSEVRFKPIRNAPVVETNLRTNISSSNPVVIPKITKTITGQNLSKGRISQPISSSFIISLADDNKPPVSLRMTDIINAPLPKPAMSPVLNPAAELLRAKIKKTLEARKLLVQTNPVESKNLVSKSSVSSNLELKKKLQIQLEKTTPLLESLGFNYIFSCKYF